MFKHLFLLSLWISFNNLTAQAGPTKHRVQGGGQDHRLRGQLALKLLKFPQFKLLFFKMEITETIPYRIDMRC